MTFILQYIFYKMQTLILIDALGVQKKIYNWVVKIHNLDFPWKLKVECYFFNTNTRNM